MSYFKDGESSYCLLSYHLSQLVALVLALVEVLALVQ